MENEPKRPTRRSRRKKQPVEVVKDTPTVDAAELEAKGFEKKRARDEKGHFVKDDPSTPERGVRVGEAHWKRRACDPGSAEACDYSHSGSRASTHKARP